ncbi:hypothetical protein VOLCADRAFT_118451 [Volvox carteri f. nagariensis]|uniref:Ubiquitin-like domain-containing protein n=1 Tax=Volvox carteri f. nagariensis TaxID=3068 RepID=D8U4Y7_VOLCA|nr:uncharacterized protein VOLCADRAFT_118451 [Volvox carteri f. nagariensis]EFJ45275.1 hypothetical protein VOLCADRAFT_118451 [Volvox carteri f. nagariensis]|eukprot:XP_002953651.1 hypothetical protein VOLCADRAFT_118451 [Volvox carteri f. nagariensis]
MSGDAQSLLAVEEAATTAPNKPSEDSTSGGASTSSEEVAFKIQFGKNSSDVKRPFDSTVGDLKGEIEKQLGIPSKLQKLMCKGAALKDDAATLRQAGIKDGSKLLLIGSNPTAVDAAKAAAAGAGAGGEWDAPKTEEPIHKQTQHAKVLAKGVPDGALPGLAGRQVPLDDKLTAIPGLLDSQGSKVRMTFKTELQQLWLGSEATTQKVPYGTIGKIESWPIEGNEGYSVVALHLGAGGTSKYWLYYFPSQYVAGLKIRILGVESLL